MVRDVSVKTCYLPHHGANGDDDHGDAGDALVEMLPKMRQARLDLIQVATESVQDDTAASEGVETSVRYGVQRERKDGIGREQSPRMLVEPTQRRSHHLLWDVEATTCHAIVAFWFLS